MASPWVDQELRDVDLKDRRLNERLGEVLSQLGSRPTASIPAACGGHAEMTAAYRLFDNDKADFDSVLHPHVAPTRRRIAGQPAVILAQDVTEIDLIPPDQQVVGAGMTRSQAFLAPNGRQDFAGGVSRRKTAIVSSIAPEGRRNGGDWHSASAHPAHHCLRPFRADY